MKMILFVLIVAAISESCNFKRFDVEMDDPPEDSLYKFPLLSPPKFFFRKPWVDLEDSLPPVGDQLEQGSCATFAASYGLVTYYEKRIGKYNYMTNSGAIDYNRIFSPSFVYNAIKNTSSDCESGVGVRKSLFFISKNGVCTWNDYPYEGGLNSCSKPPTEDIYKKALNHNGYKFFAISALWPSVWLDYLSAGYPILIAFYTSKNLIKEGFDHRNDSIFVWRPSGKDLYKYHSALVIGYENDLGLFKVMNSWTSQWGTRGYFYVPYQSLIERTDQAFIAKVDFSLRTKRESLTFDGTNLTVP